jgi:hypothetical protein
MGLAAESIPGTCTLAAIAVAAGGADSQSGCMPRFQYAPAGDNSMQLKAELFADCGYGLELLQRTPVGLRFLTWMEMGGENSLASRHASFV